MKDTEVNNIGIRALMTAFFFAVIVFVIFGAVTIYHNDTLCRRISSIINTQARISVDLKRMHKDVSRVRALSSSGSIAVMSSRLKYANLLNHARANYYAALIYGHALRNQLDPFLVYSVIQAESSFLTTAVSPKGARGLMQVMPSWTRIFHIDSDDLFHPATNIHVGTLILRDELKRYGNLRRALAAYNSGRPHGQEHYVNRVLNTYAFLAKGGH